jgi:hypothetical protein
MVNAMIYLRRNGGNDMKHEQIASFLREQIANEIEIEEMSPTHFLCLSGISKQRRDI